LVNEQISQVFILFQIKMQDIVFIFRFKRRKRNLQYLLLYC